MKKLSVTIFLFLTINLIPQLFYFWLSPDVACRTIVYGFATATCLLCSTCFFLVYWKKGIRDSAGLGVVAAVSELCTILVSVLLMMNDAGMRSSCYSLSIVCLCDLLFLVPFFVSSWENREEEEQPCFEKRRLEPEVATARRMSLPHR